MCACVRVCVCACVGVSVPYLRRAEVAGLGGGTETNYSANIAGRGAAEMGERSTGRSRSSAYTENFDIADGELALPNVVL